MNWYDDGFIVTKFYHNTLVNGIWFQTNSLLASCSCADEVNDDVRRLSFAVMGLSAPSREQMRTSEEFLNVHSRESTSRSFRRCKLFVVVGP